LLFCSVTSAGEVTLYAAASLTNVLTELSDTYQTAHPAINIKKSFAGSSTLAKQIENGAPADIFLSADNEWGDYLQKRGLLLAESRQNLLGNELVLIAPQGREVRISLDPAFNFAASFNGRLCTGEPTHVPVGKYAMQAFSHYGWWNSVMPRLVGTEDVRTALAFVERGECALGVVYKTDAMISKKVTVIASFPAESHTPIVYPGGLIKGADAEGRAFWEYLQSDAASAVFVRYGFSVLPQ
jgi:molybdate transport system substrate-binding protein